MMGRRQRAETIEITTIVGVNSSIFCLLDLMLKKPDNGTSFSMMAVLVEDNECD